MRRGILLFAPEGSVIPCPDYDRHLNRGQPPEFIVDVGRRPSDHVTSLPAPAGGGDRGRRRRRPTREKFAAGDRPLRTISTAGSSASAAAATGRHSFDSASATPENGRPRLPPPPPPRSCSYLPVTKRKSLPLPLPSSSPSDRNACSTTAVFSDPDSPRKVNGRRGIRHYHLHEAAEELLLPLAADEGGSREAVGAAFGLKRSGPSARSGRGARCRAACTRHQYTSSPD